MSRSIWKIVLALACMAAVFALGGCGGDDSADESGGTPAQSMLHQLGRWVAERP